MLTGDHVFCVPDYQRRYSWERDQWKDLWEDIYSMQSDDTHYLGNIVVVSGQYTYPALPRLEIVDGQQRLVCVSVLLIALRDYFKDKREENRVKTTDEMLKDFDLDGNFRSDRLELGALDEENYRHLLTSGPKKLKDTRLASTYSYFKKMVEKMSMKEVKDFHNKLTDNVKVVLIIAPEDWDAYRLFEGLNDRGAPLSPVDLMKNHLFRTSFKQGKVDLESVKKSWSQIMLNLGNIDEKRFFRQYMMFSKALEKRKKKAGEKESPRKVTETKLYDLFKKDLESLGIEPYLEDIESNSSLYSGICNATIEKFKPPSSNSRIQAHLRNLNDIGAAPSYTFLLRMFNENVDREDVSEILELVEMFSIRRLIGEFPTRELDTIYTHLAGNAFKKENSPAVNYVRTYLSEGNRMPDDKYFKRKFAETDFKNNSQTKYFLGEIELRHFRHLKTPEPRSTYDVHIEHIAPRSAYSKKGDSWWSEHLGVSKQEEFDRNKAKIGNLIPLEGIKNKKAKRKSFPQKKEYYKTSDFVMAQRICSYEKWNIEEIEKRTEKLADIANEIWKF
jgi:uncharacterized protein with ParB-like and HNH nuclease domain